MDRPGRQKPISRSVFDENHRKTADCFFCVFVAFKWCFEALYILFVCACIWRVIVVWRHNLNKPRNATVGGRSCFSRGWSVQIAVLLDIIVLEVCSSPHCALSVSLCSRFRLLSCLQPFVFVIWGDNLHGVFTLDRVDTRDGSVLHVVPSSLPVSPSLSLSLSVFICL